MTRYQHAGAAAPTSLASGITDSDDTLDLVDGSGYPDGSVGPFYLLINAGGANEEKVLGGTRASTTVSGVLRGQDDTTPQSHNAGEPVEHVFTAVEADQANALVQRAPSGTAALVDLSSAQALSTKTLDAASSIGGVTGSQLATLLGPAPAWTPTISNVTSPIVTVYAVQNGKMCFLYLAFSGGTATNSVTVTNPFALIHPQLLPGIGPSGGACVANINATFLMILNTTVGGAFTNGTAMSGYVYQGYVMST